MPNGKDTWGYSTKYNIIDFYDINSPIKGNRSKKTIILKIQFKIEISL